MNKLRHVIKQWLKMSAQNVFLPLLFRLYAGKPVKQNLILFADAHHEDMPYSMKKMYGYLSQKADYEIIKCCADYQKLPAMRLFGEINRFMKYYAQASFVFICDNFLPAASCKKKKETRVVQLWHAGGILKKYGYDANDDIPSFYRSNVFANYDYLTVSAKCCIPVYIRAMRQPPGVVHASGLSRTDDFFDPNYHKRCGETFQKLYPDAAGKKILLWAPTFRGKAGNPHLVGKEDIEKLARKLGDGWKVIIKAHPHVDAKRQVSNCAMPTEQLLPLADILVTDYSSVIFDYVLLEKPFVLFVPDLEESQNTRGFYIGLDEIPAPLVTDGEGLLEAVLTEYEDCDTEAIRRFRKKYMGACDGRATERICGELGI